MTERILISLSSTVAELLPPELAEIDSGILDDIATDPEATFLQWTPDGLDTLWRVVVLKELEANLPIIDGGRLRLGRADELFEFDLAVAGPPLVCSVSGIFVTLHLPPDWLQLYAEQDGDWRPVTEVEGYDLEIAFSIRVDLTGGVDVSVEPPDRLPPAMLAGTGLVVEIEGFALALDGAPRDAGFDVPEDFRGVVLPQAIFRYVKDGADRVPTFRVDHGLIGTGGFSGRGSWGSNPEGDFAQETLDAVAAGAAKAEVPELRHADVEIAKLEGMVVILQSISVEFKDTVPVASALTGHLFLPFIDDWQKFRAEIGGQNGDFLLQMGGAGDEPLVSLKNDWLEIEAESITYLVKDGVHYASVIGSVTPKFDVDIDWPTFRVENLLVSSEGDVEIDGGWIELPDTVTIDFKGFRFDISEIGFGREDADEGSTVERQWLGFSGEIALLDELPLAGSVDGLKFLWRKDEPGSDVEARLEGVGVEFEIPNALRFDGRVAYRKLTPEENARGYAGDLFEGEIALDFIALKMEIEGKLIVGGLRASDGSRFAVFFIVLSADLPTPIPLGGTGVGIYGIDFLGGMNIAPKRGDEPDLLPWFEWYRDEAPSPIPPDPDDQAETDDGEETDTTYAVTPVAKWEPHRGHFAIGFGVSLGTQMDDGFSFNARSMLAMLLPGPVIMLDGSSDFLRAKPNTRKQEGALHTLAVLDGRAGTFELNIAADYELASIIAVTGELEAYFDFGDPRAWHLWLGRDDPETRRLRAEVLSLVSAGSYVMVDARKIRFGSAVGIDWQLEFGPVELALVARFAFDAHIAWDPVLFEGEIELEGEVALRLFGIGLGLVFETALAGRAPDPYWIAGRAYLALTLPWPLPDPEIEVELEWGQSDRPPGAEPIAGAGAIHHKMKSFAVDLLEAPGDLQLNDLEATDTVPVVPVDATLILEFNRPINVSALPVRPPDEVDGWQFTYRVNEIELFELPARVDDDPLMRWPPKTDIGPVRVFSLDAESLMKPLDAERPRVRLWRYDHDERSSQYSRAADASVPVCAPLASPVTTCIDWQGVANATLPRLFSRDGVSFLASATSTTPRVKDHALVYGDTLTMSFPTPIGWLQVDFGELQIHAHVRVFLRGRLIDEHMWVPQSDRRQLLLADGFERFEADALQIEPVAEVQHRLALDDAGVSLERLCFRSRAGVDRASPQYVGADGVSSDGALSRTLILASERYYCLRLRASREERAPGADRLDVHVQERAYYFRTGLAPGQDYATNERFYDKSVVFSEGAPNRLASYVYRTYPMDSDRMAYFGQDILVAFNEVYARELLGEIVAWRVRERNGRVVDEGRGAWRDGNHFGVSGATLSWLRSRADGGCGTDDWSSGPLPMLAIATGGLRARTRYSVELASGFSPERGYQFSFTTSRFSTARDHLLSGVDEDRGVQILRRLPPADRPRLPERGSIAAALKGRDAAASELRAASAAGAAEFVHQALDNLAERTDELERRWRAAFPSLDEAVQSRFAAVELGHRPLPPKLELVWVPGHSGAGDLLIESPEPLPAERLSFAVQREDGDEMVPVPVWNRTRTRAFLLLSEEVMLAEFTLKATLDAGEDRPDLNMWTVDGSPLAASHHIRVVP